MKAKQWIAVLMFVGCLALALYSISSDDKDTTKRALSLVGMVVSGYFGASLANDGGAEDE